VHPAAEAARLDAVDDLRVRQLVTELFLGDRLNLFDHLFEEAV